jgi:hypothetical protein
MALLATGTAPERSRYPAGPHIRRAFERPRPSGIRSVALLGRWGHGRESALLKAEIGQLSRSLPAWRLWIGGRSSRSSAFVVEPFLEGAGLRFPELDHGLQPLDDRFEIALMRLELRSFGPHSLQLAIEAGHLSVLIGDAFALGAELSAEPFRFGVVGGEAFSVGALSLGL